MHSYQAQIVSAVLLFLLSRQPTLKSVALSFLRFPRADGYEHPARCGQSSGRWCLVRGPDSTHSPSSRCRSARRAQGWNWRLALWRTTRRVEPQSRGADTGARGTRRAPLFASIQQKGCVCDRQNDARFAVRCLPGTEIAQRHRKPLTPLFPRCPFLTND